jgi:antitoxin VapB
MFKSGNSQAVRLPAGIAYDDPNVELEVTRSGDVITIYPAGQNLKRLAEALRRLPKAREIEQREPIEMPDREGD